MAADLAIIMLKYRVRKSGNVWLLNSAVEREVEKILTRYQTGLQAYYEASTTSGWALLEDHSKSLTKKYKDVLEADVYEAVTAPNANALKAFLKRKSGGLKLSDRVYSLQRSTKRQIEAYLGQGLSEGKSARKMAGELELFLKRSDIKIINNTTEGNRKKRTRPGKDLRPGRGVYRSSYANALRLARNEINTAYRSADTLRRQELPFVTGIEVKLSPSHPEYDICDELKGTYPKGFDFTGWHINCLCYTTAKTMTAKQYGEFRKGNFKPDYVDDVPNRAKQYLKENERLTKRENPPEWLDNYKKEKGQYVYRRAS